MLSGTSAGPVTLNNRGGCCAEGRAEHTSHRVHSLPQQAGGHTHGSTRLETDRHEERQSRFWKLVKKVYQNEGVGVQWGEMEGWKD